MRHAPFLILLSIAACGDDAPYVTTQVTTLVTESSPTTIVTCGACTEETPTTSGSEVDETDGAEATTAPPAPMVTRPSP